MSDKIKPRQLEPIHENYERTRQVRQPETPPPPPPPPPPPSKK